jgi:hypothetical protein
MDKADSHPSPSSSLHSHHKLVPGDVGTWSDEPEVLRGVEDSNYDYELYWRDPWHDTSVNPQDDYAHRAVRSLIISGEPQHFAS